MKFRNGAWLWMDGVRPVIMRRVIEHYVDGDALCIVAVDRGGREGEDKFEGTVLQMRISSPMHDVVRVQVSHHRPKDESRAGFDLDYSLKAPKVRIEEQGDDVVFTSGRLSVRVATNGAWNLRFDDGSGTPVTTAGHESLGQMHVRDGGDRGGDYLMQRLTMGVGETIYGLGERFGPLVKNGQNVVIWNEDGGTTSDQAYKNIPFYLSSRGYGLLVNSPAKVDFEIGTERVSQMQFAVPGESLDYYVFYGPDPKSVLSKYTRLAGRPALVPPWSFGLWLSTSFTTKYDEKTVNEFVDGMIERGIPLEVFHFDCFWMKERHWCDFQWDRDAFPDPVGMLRRLKDRGLKICVWINPYISQLSSLFDEGRELGYFLKRADGSVFQRDQWQPGMALVDFTNPHAVEWYQSKLRALLEMGVDAFKTDFGERIPLDVVYHDGSDPSLMHNYYSYIYNRAVFELLEDHHGEGKAIVFARSATGGSQKFPVHWGGDCDATFESMAEDLRGGLSFCLSGAAFWSHDIGGFNGTANAALYKRWVAFGLLSTHSRLHGSNSYRVPWLFDEESVDVMRQFTRLKNRLVPYLHATARDAREHGWPMMRAMILEYPNDPACRYLDRQYMLGSSLLVAPIFREDNVAEYYLPAGKWTHLLTGQPVEGGRWISEPHEFMSVPLFARENSIIPMAASSDRPSWTANDELILHVMPLDDGAETMCEAATTDTNKRATFRATRRGEEIILHGNGEATNVKVLVAAARDPVAWPHPNEPLKVRTTGFQPVATG